MGIINHNAVLATTWDEARYKALIAWISSLTPQESRFFLQGPIAMNHYQTIVLVPDGSKEGWAESEIGDNLRRDFIEKLDEHWDWVEVGFGEFGTAVIKTNCRNRFGDEPYAIRNLGGTEERL